MFRAENLTVSVNKGNKKILSVDSVAFPSKKLSAIVGPSGCGKTTLMKAMLGMIPCQGSITLEGDSVYGADDLVGKVGLVPQFSIAPNQLKVNECIYYSLKLFTKESDYDQKIQEILKKVELDNHGEKTVENLSGGQLRRLGLALELSHNPHYLVCDEVTSGLDPNSEDYIISLLRSLVEKEQKTFLCIIHNLTKLKDFDWITVLYEGEVVFQGDFLKLLTYFSIDHPLHLYHRLEENNIDHWRKEWKESNGLLEQEETKTPFIDTISFPEKKSPNGFIQMGTLLQRRFQLLFRDRGILSLYIAITLGFPVVVVLFAFNGLPEIEWISLSGNQGFLQKMRENLQFLLRANQTASLVTGLIMFQVILLTLMGSNNGVREIVQERPLFEKERLNGLSVGAYTLSKLIFVSILAGIQGFWMAIFVKFICHFPGSLTDQALILSLCCISMSWVCLGFSAWFPSTEKASTLSIYLVGFQLPLSGVVLALPDGLVWILRPFINAYWTWSAYLSSMADTRLYDAFRLQNTDPISNYSTSAMVLFFHMLIALFFIVKGATKRIWQ